MLLSPSQEVDNAADPKDQEIKHHTVIAALCVKLWVQTMRTVRSQGRQDDLWSVRCK